MRTLDAGVPKEKPRRPRLAPAWDSLGGRTTRPGGATADESPEEVARRIRDDAERRRRRSATRPPAPHGRDDGEDDRRTADALASLPPGWRVLRRRAGPGAAPTDVRVAVGPGGAFVITGRSRKDGAADPDGTLLDDVLGDARLAEALAECRRAAGEVASAAGPLAEHVHPVLSLVGDVPPDADRAAEVEWATEGGRPVLVCRDGGLSRALAGRTARLRPGEVAELALRLETRWALAPERTGGPGATGSRAAAARWVVVVQVLLALLLLVGLLLAAPQIADRVTP